MKTRHILAGFYVLLVLFFLYGPLLIMILMGFNKSPLYTLPIQFDLVWYAKLMKNERLLQAGLNSVLLALAVSVTSTVLGTLSAWALSRFTFRGKNLLQALLVPPITIPWLIIAIALLLMFFWLGIPRGLFAMYLGHVGVSLPYVILLMSARLQGSDPDLEDAARSLGANPLQTFLKVTLPIILPGVIGALMFTFTISFDNFIISHFLAPPGVSTLPVEIYSAIRKGFTPEINAISSIIFVFSAVLILLASRRIEFT
ncbi:MAG: ABC transporter permease [Chloroflexi bacterium]|nr:ABC transporter permease [Chloroflexota bacterium]